MNFLKRPKKVVLGCEYLTTHIRGETTRHMCQVHGDVTDRVAHVLRAGHTWIVCEMCFESSPEIPAFKEEGGYKIDNNLEENPRV